MRRYLRTAAALCLALCLSLALLPAPALAEEPETAPEEVQAPEEERTEAPEEGIEETPAEGAGEEPPAPGEENPAGEMGEGEIWEEVTAEGVFQAGAISGPQTMPDEGVFFAASLSDTIAAGLAAQQSRIDVSGFNPTSAQVKEAYAKALNDHPELFYVGNEWTNWGSGGRISEVEPQYIASLTTQAAKTSFNNAVSQALAQVKTGMTDLEKALVLHDYLVVNCRYDWYISTGKGTQGANIYNAYGVLVDQNAVCQGYALAYKYLLNQTGIESVLVSSNQINHAWNAVKIEGKWYYVDVTWDDPTPNMPGHCSYDNFLWSVTSDAEKAHRFCGYDENGNKLYFQSRDWSPAVSCTSAEYQTGQIFNGVAHPMHYQDGKYWYIKKGTGYNQYALYSGELTGTPAEQQQVGEPFYAYIQTFGNGSYYPDNFGILWQGDVLYYVNSEKKLCARSLSGYGEKVLGDTEFTPSASSDNCYDFTQDGVGLEYRGTMIQVCSSTRPDVVLPAFDPVEFLTYPPDWENGFNRICGLTSDNTKVGIKWEGADTNAILYAACYDGNNRLVSVKPVNTQLTAGVNLVDITKPGSGSTFRLFLASSSKPLCAAWTEP